MKNDEIIKEINSLAGETIANQALYLALCQALIERDPALRDALARAIDSRANEMEDRVVQFGKASSPDHLLRALRIIEEIRAKVVGQP